MNAVDVLVTDNDASTATWLGAWWRGGYLRYTSAHSTCAAVGDEILLFGGDSMLHCFGDLSTPPVSSWGTRLWCSAGRTTVTEGQTKENLWRTSSRIFEKMM